MKTFVFVFLFVLGASLKAGAQTCNKSQAAQLGAIAAACEESLCSASGTDKKKFGPIELNGFFTLNSYFNLKQQIEDYKSQEICPQGCRTVVGIQTQLTGVPAKTQEPPQCASQKKLDPIRSPQFNASNCIESDRKAIDWIEDVVRGKNEPGKKLEQSEVQDCSYYATQKMDSKQTDGGCTTTVTIDVVYGKRKHSDAGTKINADVVKFWSCRK
ncbi:MAG: hypothetical protein BroJett040_24230 [Oligoflexia bacterium]|nr:MAG: hypothetical protein BroJett040_24230 [Oligoflexia bacterium]